MLIMQTTTRRATDTLYLHFVDTILQLGQQAFFVEGLICAVALAKHIPMIFKNKSNKTETARESFEFNNFNYVE